MPMTFDSFDKVSPIAEWSKFRKPKDGEELEDYRKALARHTEGMDKVQAIELWTGRPWDEWTETDKMLAILGLDGAH